MLLLGREPSTTATANLLSAQASVPEQHLRAGTMSPDEKARASVALLEMAAWPLRVLTMRDDRWEHSGGVAVPDAATAWLDTDAKNSLALGRVLIIDDLDLLTRQHPLEILPRLRARAQSTGQTILVTVPEELGLVDGEAAPNLRRHADVVLRLQRPDMYPAQESRAGEADLLILRHRQGPTAALVVAFQGHYRRLRGLN